MGDIINVTDYTLVADEDVWRPRLQAAQRELANKTIPLFLDFCAEVHAFREHCAGTQGGSTFSKKGCEWLGCSQQSLSQWDAVGRRAGELTNSVCKLPHGERAVSLLASLDDPGFEQALERVTPAMTQQDVKALIKDINPPRPKAPVNEKRELAKRIARLRREIEALPEAGLRVLFGQLKETLTIRGLLG